jgi:hypothetical protein
MQAYIRRQGVGRASGIAMAQTVHSAARQQQQQQQQQQQPSSSRAAAEQHSALQHPAVIEGVEAMLCQPELSHWCQQRLAPAALSLLQAAVSSEVAVQAVVAGSRSLLQALLLLLLQHQQDLVLPGTGECCS